jgi:hypothetical protein
MLGLVMKKLAWLLIIVLVISISLPLLYAYHIWTPADGDIIDEGGFFFGVTFDPTSTDDPKLLIDKVKDYTNLFVINSWDVTTNETWLNEVCDYAANADMKFIVYFDLISVSTYPWHRDWLLGAKTRWGDKFLGIYLHDELGGKQLEDKEYFTNASDYADAARRFLENIESYYSNQFANENNIPLFIADFGLYWWDYLGGYDTVFVELGLLLHNTTQQIAFCRGAANMQGKDWGGIIVAKTNEPPYLGSSQEVYGEMVAAYDAGAKYVIVFNHPKFPADNPYGVLNEENFEALKEFRAYVHSHPRNLTELFEGRVAFILPQNFGWGARRVEDTIWGLWSFDERTPMIWENMNRLTEKYGLKLDIVFEDSRFNPGEKYSTVYYWNSTIA